MLPRCQRITHEGRHDIDWWAGQNHPHRLADRGVVEQNADPLRRERQRDPGRFTVRINGAGIDAQRAGGLTSSPNYPRCQETQLSAVRPEGCGGREGIGRRLGPKGKPLPGLGHDGGTVTAPAPPNPIGLPV